MNAVEQRRTIGAVKEFVSRLATDEVYDYIVPIERKGTALLRATFAGGSAAWSRVLSSRAIPRKFDRPVRVLLLDDSVWKGRSLAEVKARVLAAGEAAGQPVTVTTAAFLSHAGGPEDAVDIVYYRMLNDDKYRACREAIVAYLQSEGSLLLDTEHVEVRVTVEGPINDFLRTAAAWGEAVGFPSGGRMNLTVDGDIDRLGQRLADVKPAYADLHDSVCKTRIISVPGSRSTFTVIPICFPTLRQRPGELYEHPRMKWPSHVVDERRVFDCVGLGLSLEVLADFVGWVRGGLGDRVTFDSSGSVGHLHAIFPELDEGEFRLELHRSLTQRPNRTATSKEFDDRSFEQIRRLADKIRDECYDDTSTGDLPLRRLGWCEIMQVAHRNGHSRSRASAALDMLIDDAAILPNVETKFEAGLAISRRVYGPDGEGVGRDIVRAALVAGRGMTSVVG